MALAVFEILCNVGRNCEAACIARKQEKVNSYRKRPFKEQKLAELYREDGQSPALFPVG